MSDRLIICPRGLFVMTWDGDARRERQQLVGPEALLEEWTSPVEVEGATLGDLLGHVASLSKRDRDALSRVAGSHFEPYVKEMRKAQTGATDITLIELRRYLCVERDHVAGKSGTRIELLVSVRGRTTPRSRTGWACGHSPISDYARAALVLRDGGQLVDERGRDPKVLTRFRAEWRVCDVLTALLDEFCFDGSPERRDQRMKELPARLDGPLTPIEQVWAEVDARDKREAPRRAREEWRLWRERHPGGQPAPASGEG